MSEQLVLLQRDVLVGYLRGSLFSLPSLWEFSVFIPSHFTVSTFSYGLKNKFRYPQSYVLRENIRGFLLGS